MSFARRTRDTARHLFALGEGKPAIGRGVRTAFALIVPVIAGDLLNQPSFSWAALGGWLGSLVDKGGSYRTRFMTIGAFGIFGCACALAGSEAAHSVWLAVLTMLAVGIVGGLGRLYGDEGSTVGLFIAVIYAVAAGSQSAVPHPGVLRAEMLAAGVAWAMLLSLLIWPLHPFRPARRAVAQSYRNLSEFAAALEHVAKPLGDASATELALRARAYHAPIRSSLEQARVVLAGVRKPKQGRSPRGEQLLVLTEGAEQLFGTLVAIDAELEAAHESGAKVSDQVFAEAFACLAQTLDLVATAVDDTIELRRETKAAPPELAHLEVPTTWANVHLRAASILLGRLAADVRVLVDTASRIDVRASSVVPTTAEHPAVPKKERDPFAWLRPLREALTLRSLPTRHALRMGVAAAVAVWLSFALDITRGYWATITTLIVLQPYAGATMRKTLQRVGGSVLGGIIAAALAVAARTRLAIAGVMVPFTIAAVAVLPLNYGVFVLLLTPVFVLLAEPHPGDWGIAGLRVMNTVIGGIIALVASQVLWPTHELATYPRQLAALLSDLRSMLALATGVGNASAPGWRRGVDDARRRFGVAVTNAEATMQRLMQEESPDARKMEAAMTVLTYGRRMASTLSAAAEARARGEVAETTSDTTTLTNQIDYLISSLERETPIPERESDRKVEHETAHASPISRSLHDAQMERLRVQLAVMRSAVTRFLAT